MDHYWEERAKRSVERYEQAVRQAIPEMLKAFYSTNRVVVGVNYPPFHVNCRTVAVPHYPTTDTARMTRAARDAEDNPITVPADMKYEEWYETYIEKLPESGIIKPNKVIEGHQGIPKKAEAGMVIDHIGKTGSVDVRTFYGQDGMKQKDIHTTNHNNPAQHPYGTNGEHAHDYEWDPFGNLKNKTSRELSEEERKENTDIL